MKTPIFHIVLFRDWWRPCQAFLVLVSFLSTSIIGPMPVFADDGFRLPAPGVMVHLSPPLDPPILKGIKVHPENPFRFDFILDKGDAKGTDTNSSLRPILGQELVSVPDLRTESTKLIKYFLASLTIPEKDLWVNLSPYEKDRIIPQSFGLTEMGRDLLAEDYMLKQITASLIYPEDAVGKKFWKRVYEEAQKKYGTTNVPVNTFNKVWIVPEKAVVYENAKAGTAYVVESKLKVMLEKDYLSMQKHGLVSVPNTHTLGSQIIREIVIPALTKEVNEGKNFAQLRQVYNSLILATWYKKKIKDSILSQVYSEKSKVAGVNIDDPQEKEKIYQRYLKAFKKGAYNYIKEEVDPLTQETISRKYFSGGLDLAMNATNLGSTELQIVNTMDPAMLNDQNDLDVQADISQVKNASRPKANRAGDIEEILKDPWNQIDQEFRHAAPKANKKGKGSAQESFEKIQNVYGFLPHDNPLQQFVFNRLKAILPDISQDELPNIYVLAKRGYGINAFVYPDDDIVVSPELLGFIRYQEELDGILLHELAHTSLKHAEAIGQTAKGRSIMKSLGVSRLSEYEADTLAFYQMQDPKRSTSPLGLLISFERMRREGLTEWDFAHGDVNDRILNLKLLMRNMDVSGIDKPLTSLREFWEPGKLGEAVEKLPVRQEQESPKETKNQKVQVQADLNLICQRINGTLEEIEKLKRTENIDSPKVIALTFQAVQEARRIRSFYDYKERREDILGIAGHYLSGQFLGQLLQALANDEEDYRKLAELYSDDLLRIISNRNSLEDINIALDRLYALDPKTNPFFPPFYDTKKVRLEDFKEFQIYVLDVFSKEKNQKDYINKVRSYLQRWSVVSSMAGLNSVGAKIIFESKFDILQKGMALIKEGGSDKYELMFLMSFFIEDVSLQISLRKEGLIHMMEQKNFGEIIHLVFDEYACQRMIISFDVLNLLDQKAQAPEDFDHILQAMARLRKTQNQNLNTAAAGVLQEAMIKFITKKADPKELFSALIESQKNDLPLKKVLSRPWWLMYRSYISKDLVESKNKHKTEDYDDLERWAQDRKFYLNYTDWLEGSIGDGDVRMKDFSPAFIPFKMFLDRIYRLGDMEKYILLRQLLAGNQGLLNGLTGRRFVIDKLFDTYIQTSKDVKLSDELRKILQSFVENAPKDEVFLTLAPLLQGLIAKSPKKSYGWPMASDFLSELVPRLKGQIFDVVDDRYIEDHIEDKSDEREETLRDRLRELERQEDEIYGSDDGFELNFGSESNSKSVNIVEIEKIKTDLLEQKFNTYIHGNSPGSVDWKVQDEYVQLLPGSKQDQEVQLTPMSLILQAARQMGAPGVRFLQLLGQTIDLPESVRQEFIQVYDNMQGQTKLAAWKTIEKYTPDYAKRIKRVIRRIGGGSLITVFEAEVLADETDYPDKQGQTVLEVVRVLNPNALYHARNSIDIIRDTLEGLSEKNPAYKQALPLVDLLEGWVQEELADANFEEQDKEFHDQWHGTKPSGFTGSIYVPRSIATGTGYVRREELINDAVNLTSLKSLPPAKAKAAVSLAVQFYLAQITGSWNKFLGMAKSTVLVHSDISPGNLAVKPNGDLVIFDRGYYLIFDRKERMWLNNMAKAKDLSGRTEVLVDYLLKLPENKEISVQLQTSSVVKDIVSELNSKTNGDSQKTALQMNRAVTKRGIKIPLKYTLLFKNFNALDHLTKEVGFRNLIEAAAYKPDQAMNAKEPNATNGPGGIDLTPANMNLQTQNNNGEIKFHIDQAMLTQLQNAPGFTPVIINIQPLKDLSGFLGLKKGINNF